MLPSLLLYSICVHLARPLGNCRSLREAVRCWAMSLLGTWHLLWWQPAYVRQQVSLVDTWSVWLQKADGCKSLYRCYARCMQEQDTLHPHLFCYEPRTSQSGLSKFVPHAQQLYKILQFLLLLSQSATSHQQLKFTQYPIRCCYVACIIVDVDVDVGCC